MIFRDVFGEVNGGNKSDELPFSKQYLRNKFEYRDGVAVEAIFETRLWDRHFPIIILLPVLMVW